MWKQRWMPPASRRLLRSSITEFHHLNGLLCQCRFLLQQLGFPLVKHVMRECNKCADLLANDASTRHARFFCFTIALFLFVFWHNSRMGQGVKKKTRIFVLLTSVLINFPFDKKGEFQGSNLTELWFCINSQRKRDEINSMIQK